MQIGCRNLGPPPRLPFPQATSVPVALNRLFSADFARFGGLFHASEVAFVGAVPNSEAIIKFRRSTKIPEKKRPGVIFLALRQGEAL